MGAQLRDERPVGLEPADLGPVAVEVEVAGSKPTQLLMLDRMRLSVIGRRRVRHPQHQLVVDGHLAGEPARDGDVDAELLPDLANQRTLWRLAVLNLAAGQLPAWGRRTTRGKHPASPDDRGADDDHCHGTSLARRPGRRLVTTVAAPTPAPVTVPPMAPDHDRDASAGEPSGFLTGHHLRRTEENAREIDALADLVGGRAGVDGLLDDLKYAARRARVPRLLGRAVRRAITWDRYDTRDPRWWPQGISTSADASDTEDIAGRRVLVMTWYSKGIDGSESYGSRVSFLDLDSMRYRHVLLVVPTLDDDGALSLAPLRIHAGGIVWAGPYLHIAATERGFVTCRVDDILRVPGSGDRPGELGVVGNQVFSYGHRYVLPVRFRYRAYAADGVTKLRYSFLSLDRASSPPGLVAGEYGRGEQTTRLARFRLDPATWQLETDDDGHSRPLAPDEHGPVQMQGAAIARGRFHVTVSRGPWWPGDVYAGLAGNFKRHRMATPMGPEDVAYWPSADLLWSLTEHPRRRWVFAMPRGYFDR